MFKNLISKASELGKKAQNMATDYLAKPNPNMPDKRTDREKETDDKIREIFKEIQNLKEICHDEYEKKITEVTVENGKLKKSYNHFKNKNEELEQKLKANLEIYENLRKNNDTILENKENEVKELEEKLQNLTKKQLEVQEEKYKSSFIEDCQKIEERHNKLIESIKSINLTEVLEQLKASISATNEQSETCFSNVLDAKSKEIISIINSKEELNEDDKSLMNLNIVNGFNEMETKLTDSLNSKIMDVFEKNMKESLEKSICLVGEIKDFLTQDLENIKKTLETYNKEGMSLKETNNDLYDKLLKETKKYETEKKALEECSREKTNLDQELNKKEEIIKEKLSLLSESESRVSSLEEEKNTLQLTLDTLKINFKNSDNLCNDLCEKIKNLESNSAQITKNLEEKNNKFETSKQIVKNIFTLYLEEEYFIDSIEKCFKNQELNTEETLKTSKVIKINLVVKLYKYIFNEIFKPKLSKYKAFEKVFNEVSNINYDFKNLEQFYAFSERLVTDENNLLNRFITDLLDIYESQSKSIMDLRETLKKSKDIVEESKKNDVDTKELLIKQIAKLQGDCKEYVKTEKTLRETIESIDNNLKEEKAETAKLNTKNKTLKQAYDNLEKEYNALKENFDNISQKIDLYKLENSELMEKFKDKTNELLNEKENLEGLLSEKRELENQLKELDKLRITVKEKNEIINTKEIEINKLKNSYHSLEEIFENMKDHQDKEKDDLKQQLMDALDKKNEMEISIKTLEEKHSQSSQTSQIVGELTDKISNLELENVKLKEQKADIKRHAEEVLIKVKNDLKDTEYLIDKRIISSFLFKYLDRNNNEKIRIAVLDTLSNFLGFTNEERKKIGLNPSTGMNMPGMNATDKLKDISDDLYNFILNA